MGLTIVGDIVYLADFREGLRVIDVSDPENPEELGFCDTPGRAYEVDVWGEFAYVADGTAGVRKIDVTNPEDPRKKNAMGFTILPEKLET